MNAKTNFISKAGHFFDKVVDVIMHICSWLLLAMTLLNFVQVTLRSVFNHPFSWSEEVTLMLLVWFGYLAMSTDIYHDSHAALFFLYNKMPPAGQKALDILRQLLLTVFFVLLVRHGYTITMLNISKLQPATRLSSAILYLPLPVVGCFMLLSCLFLLLKYIFKPLSSYKVIDPKKMSIEQKARERGGAE